MHYDECNFGNLKHWQFLKCKNMVWILSFYYMNDTLCIKVHHLWCTVRHSVSFMMHSASLTIMLPVLYIEDACIQYIYICYIYIYSLMKARNHAGPWASMTGSIMCWRAGTLCVCACVCVCVCVCVCMAGAVGRLILYHEAPGWHATWPRAHHKDTNTHTHTQHTHTHTLRGCCLMIWASAYPESTAPAQSLKNRGEGDILC